MYYINLPHRDEDEPEPGVQPEDLQVNLDTEREKV
jgi:hypothetical protein